MRRWLWAGVLALVALAGCSDEPAQEFKIVAGSENRTLEPVVQAFCKDRNFACVFDYQGSLDIGAMLAPGQTPAVDAVWPAASLWVDLYDTGRRVKNLRSISQSPVVLGVRLSKAKALGWIDRPVATKDIVEAVKAGQLRFLMTSATQSNSGASGYLAMLAVLAGEADVIEPADLLDPALRDSVKQLLSGIERSSGSSGWLKDLFLANRPDGSEFDAMWNYESVLKEANDELARTGKEKLWAVYPADGVFVADSPLGFLDRGRGTAIETFFNDLQAHLLKPKIQAQIAGLGRRVALPGGKSGAPEPDWNFDPGRLVTSVRTPAPEVIRAALVLYQEVLRPPSLTAFCLDYSGSMEGDGEAQLKEAMGFVLTPSAASEALVQWTPKDRILVLLFTSVVEQAMEGDGSPESQSRLLAFVKDRKAAGGTDMYRCLTQAESWLAAQADRDAFLPAILVLTDGKSEGSFDEFAAAWRNGPPIPVFGVAFGDADEKQLDAVAELTRARVFDGRKDLRGAFRAARGYN
jgi:Ca-activated chloride channel homolog